MLSKVDKQIVGYKGMVSVCDIIREVRSNDWQVGDVIKYMGALCDFMMVSQNMYILTPKKI